MPHHHLLIGALLGCGCERPQSIEAPTPTSSSPSAPGPGDAGRPPPLFGIGGGEHDQQTHISFDAPKQLVGASVHVVVDRTAPTGLNFFALQVDFANGTWAHGGLQDVDGPDGKRTRQVNWGGLVDRGGGTADYEQERDQADLEKIQNPPLGEHVGPYPWRNGVEYEYRVERGDRVTLPPGDYHLIPDRPSVHLDHPRTLWAWRFTVRPVAEAGASYVAVLYDGAASFDAFYVWNESGYGSTDAAQHTSWWAPLANVASGPARAPAAWQRF